MNVTSRFDFSSIVVEHDQTVTLMVRIKAPPAPAFTKRKPLNLALVLDRSGSMAGDKIDYLRLAATQLVQELTPDDRLAVVIFDEEIETIVAPQRVQDKAGIIAALRRIHARNSTNLSGGWMQGLTHVESGFAPDMLNRALLLTDGLANQGIRDPDRLRSIGAQYRVKGISTTTLGFGADFNETLLAEIADDAGGAFYFIKNPDDAPAVFAEELGELLKVVGQNLTVELRMRPPARFIAVLNRYPAEQIDAGLRLRVGDLFGNEQREILADVWIPALRELGPREVGEIIVDLDQVVDPVEHHRIELPIEVNVVQPEQAPSTPDPEVSNAATLLRISEIRDKVIPLINLLNFKGAQEVIDEAVRTLEAKGPLLPKVAQEIERLRQELQNAQDLPQYGSKGTFYEQYRQRRGKGDYRSSGQ